MPSHADDHLPKENSVNFKDELSKVAGDLENPSGQAGATPAGGAQQSTGDAAQQQGGTPQQQSQNSAAGNNSPSTDAAASPLQGAESAIETDVMKRVKGAI